MTFFEEERASQPQERSIPETDSKINSGSCVYEFGMIPKISFDWYPKTFLFYSFILTIVPFIYKYEIYILWEFNHLEYSCLSKSRHFLMAFSSVSHCSGIFPAPTVFTRNVKFSIHGIYLSKFAKRMKKIKDFHIRIQF